jgi:hypothetical protein
MFHALAPHERVQVTQLQRVGSGGRGNLDYSTRLE